MLEDMVVSGVWGMGNFTRLDTPCLRPTAEGSRALSVTNRSPQKVKSVIERGQLFCRRGLGLGSTSLAVPWSLTPSDLTFVVWSLGAGSVFPRDFVT